MLGEMIAKLSTRMYVVKKALSLSCVSQECIMDDFCKPQLGNLSLSLKDTPWLDLLKKKKEAYELYFVRLVIQTRPGLLIFVYKIQCWFYSLNWDTPKPVPFAVLMIWRGQNSHIRDCYFCLILLVSLLKIRNKLNNQICLQPRNQCHMMTIC